MASVWDGARPLPRGPGARSRVYCAISVILAMFLAVELNLGRAGDGGKDVQCLGCELGSFGEFRETDMCCSK
eukprot:1225666-Amorphochlora_amoeboformis.AAC.1